MDKVKKVVGIVLLTLLLGLYAWGIVGMVLVLFYGEAFLPWLVGVTVVIGVAVIFVLRRSRKENRVKNLLGVLFVVGLSLLVILGSIYAISYLIARLESGFLSTSFPWYTGYGFAGICIGPWLVVDGITLTIMHFRDRSKQSAPGKEGSA